MQLESEKVNTKGLNWLLRSAWESDARSLSALRVLIDAETENLAREPGEALLSEEEFKQMIKADIQAEKNIFLVVEVEGQLVGFARCVQLPLKRFNHQCDFGICILKDYCGYGIGNELLKTIVSWSETNGIEKISLNVIEDNLGAIHLYKRHGFVEEGLLIKDRKHNDGSYHNTVLMGRIAK